MGQLIFKPRTIDSEIVRDGLCAVSNLDRSEHSRDLCFVVGGMATQSYLPTSCRRPTTDIDLAVLKPLSYSDFKHFAKEAIDYLMDSHYLVETKKGHNSHHLIYSNNSGEAGVIEFARRNANNHERIFERLLREKRNTRKKIVEARTATYEVSSPEDIAIPKIVRGVGYLFRNPEFNRYIRAERPVAIGLGDVERGLEEIAELREQAIIHAGDPSLSERLRLVSDIFDIRMLSEAVGYNPSYLKEAAESWDKLKVDSPEKKALFDYLFPSMAL